MSEWKPIEEAPSGDGEFLGGYWWRERWIASACKFRVRPTGDKVIEARTRWRFPATHWMPLPDPPK